uniref:NADP-dependent oxidoreductase domain-containing protein n=1 Tax=Oryctolagus cuniculus TaxID=9986 RepID=G1TUM5_RABIT
MDPRRYVMELNDGNIIPVLGFGTAAPIEVSKHSVLRIESIDAGFRHFDSAIRSKIAEGIVERKDIFYTSKLWCTSHRPELVQQSLEESLRKVQLDYVDLYIIHFPMALKPSKERIPKDENGKVMYDTVDLCATWEAMEKCKDAGLAKSIGVSNFNHKQLEMILNKPGLKYKPVCTR